MKRLSSRLVRGKSETDVCDLASQPGTVGVTLSPVAVQDDFSGHLAQWTTGLRSGFAVTGGYLANSNSDDVLVNATEPSIGNGECNRFGSNLVIETLVRATDARIHSNGL